MSLLEALSYGCHVVASDIPENRNIYDEQISFFEKGNVESLLNVLDKVTLHSEDDKNKQIEFIKTHYNWKQIIEETTDIYREVMNKND